MADLSKIDFSKCELPKWMFRDWAVMSYNAGHSIQIRNAGHGGVASRSEGQWVIRTDSLSPTFTELDELERICDQVDAFIASELKRLADEELPPWRECGLDEAEEFSFWDAVDLIPPDWSSWRAINGRLGGLPKTLYRYRTRKPLPENPKLPTVKPPEGCEWVYQGGRACLRNTVIGWCVGVPLTAADRDEWFACCAASDEMRGKTVLRVISDGGVRSWAERFPCLARGEYEVLFRKIG